jgi:hypothetical protein
MLVLDFDGTVTDAEQEGKPFRAGYLQDLAALTNRSLDEIQAMAERFEAEVAADPDNHGWQYGGAIVAPATVDPYLRIMPVARKVFDTCRIFMDPDDRNRLLDGVLYRYNYQKTLTAFRPGARELLAGLAGTATYVVTNSHTDPVRGKIRTLAQGPEFDWLLERVHGRARKYVIDPEFTDVPESLAVPGLSRPILLRRRKYFEVLSALLERERQDWSQLLVVGDIFELDLALPLALGARVGLVVNQFTPGYEREFVTGHERGHLLESLADVRALVRD